MTDSITNLDSSFMNILIWSFKGGVGKTTLSLSIALAKKFGIISNDLYSPIEDILPVGHARILSIAEEIPEIPKEYDIIYDMGGHIDKRIVDVAQKVDCAIIPTRRNTIDLKSTVNCINEVKGYVKNIIVVCNFCKNEEDLVYTKEVVNEYFQDIPVMPLKESKLFGHFIDKKTNIDDLVSVNGLSRYIYNDVYGQFQAILSKLNLN